MYTLSVILCICWVSSGQMLDGTLTSLNQDWKSGQDSGTSLVSTPIIDFLNDTAVSFVWELQTTDFIARLATNFDLEIARDHYSDDFQHYTRVPADRPEDYSNNSFVSMFTVSGLQPVSDYRFRVCPVFSNGRGQCSAPLPVTTLANSVNYWEPTLPRRLSLVASGRGFTNPVVQRPHLSTGVEVFNQDTSDNPMRYSDAPTSETPVLPSGRRGHSLSRVDGNVYMFGGRTNGYSCATIYKDTMNLGNIDSGRDVYPCVHYQSEVSELWSFDTSTYQWIFLNTSKWQTSPPPPAREQHSAIVVDRDVYIYGGKTRVFEKDSSGNNVYVRHSDVVFGDLWKLAVERAKQFTLRYDNSTTSSSSSFSSSSAVSIPQSEALYAIIDGRSGSVVADQSDGISNREGLCIDKTVVRIRIDHPCVNQLKVSILGPGPQSGSPNYFPPSDQQEIVLFSRLTTNGTGCVGGIQSFEFDDASLRRPDACCPQEYSGTYQPQGRLSEFIGASMTANWTLVVQDVKADSIVGELLGWEIEFTASPCVETYTWTNLTIASAPPRRYGARALAHQSSIFVYGGRDSNDAALNDLYRYDTLTALWTRLDPINFAVALNPASSVGANFALTSWGLLRYGGYYRQPTLAESYDNYDSSIAVQDPVTLRWQEVHQSDTSPLPRDATFGRVKPSHRYLSAAVFIPSHAIHWDTKYNHHNLYDDVLPSSRTNYQGTISDSLLVIGGFDGSTGSVVDGSSGGFLMDAWMLRLGNWSTAGARDRQQQYLERNCRWRNKPSALNGTSSTASCMSTVENTRCEWRDLMLLPWCSFNNQTII